MGLGVLLVGGVSRQEGEPEALQGTGRANWTPLASLPRPLDPQQPREDGAAVSLLPPKFHRNSHLINSNPENSVR